MKQESKVYSPIPLADYLKQNIKRFDGVCNIEEFKIIFEKVVLENFGPIQLAKKILENIQITAPKLKNLQNIDRVKHYLFANKKNMIDMVDLSDAIALKYYMKFSNNRFENEIKMEKRNETLSKEVLLKKLESYTNYIGIEELATIFEKSKTNIRRLLKEGKIKKYMTSNIFFFKKEDVKEYIEKNIIK